MIDINIETALNHTLKKIKHNAYKLSEFLQATETGYWQQTPVDFCAGGFWIGLLWLACSIKEKEKYKGWAYKWIQLLERWKNYRTFNIGAEPYDKQT